MAYIVKDEQDRPVIYKGSNVMGSDSFEDIECLDFNDKDHSFLAVGSQESPDRFRDVIQVDGWELKNYRKNPVVLFAHNYGSPPIGKSLEEFSDVKKNIKRLMIRPQFHTLTEEARTLYSLYKEKYLRGFSVGFLPKKSEEIKQDDKKKDDDEHQFFHRPILFKKQELLENSSVPLPAHPDALAEIKTLVKKGSLYIPARYLQEKQTPEVEVYDEYIHIKVEDEGRFKTLYEDEVGEGVVRVFGQVDGEFMDHKFIFAKNAYTEEQAKDLANIFNEHYPTSGLKKHDPEAYIARETVLIDAFPTLDEKAFAVKGKRQELETAKTDTDNANDQLGEEERCESCLDELGREYTIGKDIDFEESEYIDAEDVEEKPYPNEHACRLLPPGDFDRFARKNCFRRSGGKCIDFIFGIKAGKSKTQAMRYKKDVWTASAARSHCSGADGTFEAAGKMIEEIDASKKIYVYRTTKIMEEEEIKRVRDSLKGELGEDVIILIVDGGAKLEVLKLGEVTQLRIESGGDIGAESAEEERDAGREKELERLKSQVEDLWGIKVTDEVAEILKGLSERMDLDLVKAVLDVSDALSALKPEKEGVGDLDELDEDETITSIDLKSQTEEIREAMEKIIDEVVDRVVRAVRSELKSMRGGGKAVEEDDKTIDLDIERDLEDENLEDIDSEDDGAGDNGPDEDVETDDEDEIAAVVSDSLREALGKLD